MKQKLPRRPSTPFGQGAAHAWLREHVTYQGDDCLQWPFFRDSRVGRGRLGHKGEMHWAHRLMCELAHGKPPTPKHQAAHNCGKGHYGCVNPRHLEWKTNSENQLDRRRNGNMLRNPNGQSGNISQAQKAEIVALRAGGMTQVAIAQKFGVSLGCVQYHLKYRKDRGHDQQKHRLWQPDEDRILRAGLAAGTPVQDLAKRLGRSVGSVAGHIKWRGIIVAPVTGASITETPGATK